MPIRALARRGSLALDVANLGGKCISALPDLFHGQLLYALAQNPQMAVGIPDTAHELAAEFLDREYRYRASAADPIEECPDIVDFQLKHNRRTTECRGRVAVPCTRLLGDGKPSVANAQVGVVHRASPAVLVPHDLARSKRGRIEVDGLRGPFDDEKRNEVSVWPHGDLSIHVPGLDRAGVERRRRGLTSR